MRQALGGVHAAERKLLRANHRVESAKAVAAIAAQSASATAAKAQGISSHYAGKIAAIGTSLDPQQRTAAIAQLKLEEGVALANMFLETSCEAEAQRHTALGPLKSRHRTALAALSQRQRRERMTFTMSGPGQRSPSMRRNRRHRHLSVRTGALRLFRSSGS